MFTKSELLKMSVMPAIKTHLGVLSIGDQRVKIMVT